MEKSFRQSHPGEDTQVRESGRVSHTKKNGGVAAVDRTDEREPPRFPLISLFRV
jgi:hypothetical protein